MTTNSNSRNAEPPDPPAISLPAAVRELFALAERIQTAQGVDAMSAFYAAKCRRPDLFAELANAEPQEVNEILERIEREKEQAA